MVPPTPYPPDILTVSSDAFRVALELSGVMAAHRAAYDPVRAELLEVAESVLADALGQALVSRRAPPPRPRRYGGGRP